jgi:hypothetical protein
MLIALAVLAALETAPPPAAVEMTLSGSSGAPVSAAPRTLSDVAREMREGRRAVGGFSAFETTLSREPLAWPAFERDEEEPRPEPEARPEPQPPESAVPYVTGWGAWYGGGWGDAPHRRPPHVSHFGRPSARRGPHAGAGAGGSARGGGGPRIPRSSSRAGLGVGTWVAPPRR